MKRHRDGLEHQLPLAVTVAFLHQLTAIESTVIGHEIEIIRTPQELQSPLHRRSYAHRIPQLGTNDKITAHQEAVHRRQTDTTMNGLQCIPSLSLAMGNGDMVNFLAVHSLRHIRNIVPALGHTKQQVALGKSVPIMPTTYLRRDATAAEQSCQYPDSSHLHLELKYPTKVIKILPSANDSAKNKDIFVNINLFH